MAALLFAWSAALIFVASLAFFLYCYLLVFALPTPPGTPLSSDVFWKPVAANVALFSIFALHHSLFARTGVKRLVSSWLSPPLERSFYTLVASLLFIVVCGAWRPVPGEVYSLGGPWRWVGYTAVVAGLVLTALGARALDVLDLAGVRQVLDDRAGALAAPPGPLKTTGLYGFVRHPVYFAWVLVVFGVPHMTLTRFVFALVSTVYLAVAIPFEERSLVETFGPDYASYRQKVRWRMLPGIY